MQKTKELESGGFYMIESLSSGNSSYFESAEEMEIFKSLAQRYLGHYVEIYKMYISCEGYQLMIRLRSSTVLRRLYSIANKKKGKVGRIDFIIEPWRIVSEQIRILHSVYVKVVNKRRGRKGVLVMEKYNRYYFSSEEEFNLYTEEMEMKKRVIKGQTKEDYMVSKEIMERVKWGIYRCKEWVESIMDRAFQNYVVSKLINLTLKLHSG